MESGAVGRLAAGTVSEASPAVAQIAKIRRYVPDSLCSLLVPEGLPDNFKSFYDVTLYDGTSALRCVLRPTLNGLIEKGEIQESQLILVRSVRCWRDEATIGGPVITILCDIASLAEIEIPAPPNTRSLNEIGLGHNRHTPLIGSRGYYAPLWDETDFVSANHESIFPREIAEVEEQEITPLEKKSLTIADIKQRYHSSQQTVVNFNNFSLIGRVVQISPIRHYASPNDRKRPFPINFTFEIVAGGQFISVTAWNRACATYFAGLTIGAVVCIERFRVQVNSLTGELEVSVNSSNPTGVIRKMPSDYSFLQLSDEHVEEQELDEKEGLIDLRIIPLKGRGEWSLSVPDKFVFDFVGCVTHIGRLERERKDATPYRDDDESEYRVATEHPPTFIQYRWVSVVDLFAPETELIIKVAACGNNNILHDMAVGKRYVFYNISLFSVWDSYYRKVYLHTLPNSHVLLVDQVKRQNWATYRILNQLLKVAHSEITVDALNHHSLLRESFYPGANSVFLWSSDFMVLQGALKLPILYFRELKSAVEALHYQEHVQCLAQGYIEDIHMTDIVEIPDQVNEEIAVRIQIQLQNINQSESIKAEAILLPSQPAIQQTHEAVLSALTGFFPSALFKQQQRTSLSNHQYPTHKEGANAAFFAFKHRVLDKKKLASVPLKFILHISRQAEDRTEIFLLPPHVI